MALDTGLVAGVIIWRIAQAPDSFSILDLGPLLVAAGVLTALIAFLFNLRRARSEDLLEAATDLLEKAYENLAPKGESTLPSNRRLTWLSTARLIITAETLGKRITEPSHELIYREKKEYWRTRLYELIWPSIEGLPSSFYAESPEHMIARSGDVRDPLSEKSLAFLYRFVRWPEDTPDPLGNEPNFTDEEIDRMRSFGPRGLGSLIAEARRLRQSEVGNDAQPGVQAELRQNAGEARLTLR
ncbi:MAG: hypothetical protein EPO60_08155 [Rugosibacter sp.]|nr:MAG: hypothetical protein EPO60_08155 [Rugosibacter sp.]